MKIIKVDNSDCDFAPDVLIAESIHPYYIDFIVQALNDKYGGSISNDYFSSADDMYKLYMSEC